MLLLLWGGCRFLCRLCCSLYTWVNLRLHDIGIGNRMIGNREIGRRMLVYKLMRCRLRGKWRIGTIRAREGNIESDQRRCFSLLGCLVDIHGRSSLNRDGSRGRQRNRWLWMRLWCSWLWRLGNTIHVRMTCHRCLACLPCPSFSTFEPKGTESVQNTIANAQQSMLEEDGKNSFKKLWSNLGIWLLLFCGAINESILLLLAFSGPSSSGSIAAAFLFRDGGIVGVDILKTLLTMRVRCGSGSRQSGWDVASCIKISLGS